MTALHDQQSGKVIFKLLEIIRKKLPANEAKMVTKFARYYYATIAEDELKSRDPMALYGALASHWAFIKKRKPNEVKLRVYNPSIEKQGWESRHTVVEVSQIDKPFLVDSLLMELNRLGLNIHFIVHVGNMRVKRDRNGNIKEILTSRNQTEGFLPEAQIYIEVDRQPDDTKVLKDIEHALAKILSDVALVVDDFPTLKTMLEETVENLKRYSPKHIQAEEVSECLDFLEWLDTDHFTFLGYAEYKLNRTKQKMTMTKVESSTLGILRQNSHFGADCFEGVVESTDVMRSEHPLLITKSDCKATVHRAAHMDVVVVKQFDAKSKVMGERRFIGLYTSSAYHGNPRYIPFLRRKAAQVLKRSGFDLKGHDGKTLINILESFPRDELFQISEDQLYRTVMGILQIQERQRIRLFVRRDVFGRFYSCMVYVPRDLYNTELRMKMQNILMREFGGIDSAFTPNFLESVLCRIDFIIRVDPNNPVEAHDVRKIESKLVVAARDWRDDLKDSLVDNLGEHKGTILYNRYARAFPAGYRERFLARSAVIDIDHVEQVLENDILGMCFYRMLEEPEDFLRFKLFRKGQVIPLTDVLPILENMGLRVIEERPYEVRISPDEFVWISDFGMQVRDGVVDINQISEIFQAAFAKAWYGEIENDNFNRLVVCAGLPWQEVLIFRAYAKYFQQIAFRYSQTLIENTLSTYPQIVRLIVKLFHLRFDPKLQSSRTDRDLKQVRKEIYGLLDVQVNNLDSDRILRRYVDVIMATRRTNYYQTGDGPKQYVSFKMIPSEIPDMPQPLPKYEIFVYSPQVEGVHLRGARVARGGLRWSDRREDFRTEVLGLMKAQQVKNAVIVPMGAKGGFVPKNLPHTAGREAVMEEAIECYKTFICGLLDITDNLKKNKIIPPKNVVRHDDDDSYLVVAADKGTASFSDIANGVAEEYGFWLGDAFASGGSHGYDHKKMGITARGAWESVKRHFLEFGHDTQSQDFTVVGIGDMSGDVFGNGMLLSKHIRLVAAFNHMHIFIDPDPDAAKGYEERKRLFNLPRSSWADYNPKLISKGGGIFERSAKSIKLTPQMQALLDVTLEEMEPNQLIQAILSAKVDLLWNGGIGTYVKASSESNHDVGDRNNDLLRISASQLRCRVVGEGGNLGFTQLARIEYALAGGLIYTDAIDNSAGVDCSDHEVNIKILLNDAMRQGDLTFKQRNNLLAQMRDEVADLVLRNNYMQTQAISSGLERVNSLSMHIRLLQELEREKQIDRGLEFLPSDKELKARRTNEQGLTAPEFAVLMAYTKTLIQRAILDSTIPEEPYFRKYLEMEFPEVLRKKFGKLMGQHRLHREIIATQLTNELVHYMGITFVHRMYDETGATPAMTARAFVIAFEVYDMAQWWEKIQKLDGQVNAHIQYHMMNDIFRLVRRTARWLLRNRRRKLEVPELVAQLKAPVTELLQWTSKFLGKDQQERKQRVLQKYAEANVPKGLARQIADFRYLSPVLDVVEAHLQSKYPLKLIGEVYYELSDQLSFGWMRTELSHIRDYGYWELLSGSALRDDLDALQRRMAVSVIHETDDSMTVRKRVKAWMEQYDYLVRRWVYMVSKLKLADHQFVRYSAAMRALRDLSEVCTYGGTEVYRIHEDESMEPHIILGEEK